ncbi:CopG family transcriptional regulator [Caballeronia sp. CLC5]|uniref:ribbon-helix-helix domain-containing protein n=1 Tax=Caballeronia sp. CLC5 TaxID=2906764 RepID=UPI001F40BF17|nr:CopG family transcriptional regulator [Caballeronia sp. CLC5]MCE4568631.1 ribbon-helix-helix domain-containing protein [Caballeronia sp. CLC5]MCE4570162.1 ribbon-helix-helix domain-containing protein [Caballeronia sp. CLC5]
MRVRLNVYFPPELARQVSELAIRRRISRSAIVEAAVTSWMSPDGSTGWRPRSRGGSTVSRARFSGSNATPASPPRRWRCSCVSGWRSRHRCRRGSGGGPGQGASAMRVLSRRSAGATPAAEPAR